MIDGLHTCNAEHTVDSKLLLPAVVGWPKTDVQVLMSLCRYDVSSDNTQILALLCMVILEY